MAYTLLDAAYAMYSPEAEFAAPLGGKKASLLKRLGRGARRGAGAIGRGARRAGGFAMRNKGKLALAGAAGLGLAAVANRKKIGGAIGGIKKRYGDAGYNEVVRTAEQGIAAGTRISQRGMKQANLRGMKNQAREDIGSAVGKVKSFNPFRKK